MAAKILLTGISFATILRGRKLKIIRHHMWFTSWIS